jgi:hypothetical protein
MYYIYYMNSYKLYIYLVFFSIAHASTEKRSEKIEQLFSQQTTNATD